LAAVIRVQAEHCAWRRDQQGEDTDRRRPHRNRWTSVINAVAAVRVHPKFLLHVKKLK
jgi:hypothetical protein